MLKLVRYLRGYGKECVLAPLFKCLEAAFQILVPLVMASVVDEGIAAGNTHHIMASAAALIAMGFVGWVCAVAAQYFSAKLGAGFGTALRDDLFAHVMSLSRSDVDELGTSTLVTRLTNDTSQVQDGVNLFFRLVLRCPIALL
ncbi:ABC transporter transmembrane domain-containing protein, partial [Parolsenella catena]|uniref:ABC transporter transmembrane domain-containing protein n=1 Tax=Parolsenella catena TaxID=2003188 RepID=UPI003077425F